MSDPHAAMPGEDPEDHIGEVIPDPWDDPAQTDWATVRGLDLYPPTQLPPVPMAQLQEGDWTPSPVARNYPGAGHLMTIDEAYRLPVPPADHEAPSALDF